MTSLLELTEAIRRKPFVTEYCSLCGYGLNYCYRDNQFGLDSGCYCVSNKKFNPHDETVLHYYLNPENGQLNFIKKFINETKGIIA
jgi:hypothetical protein